MKYCSNCGQPTVEDAKFCASCGTALNEVNDQILEIQKEEKRKGNNLAWTSLGLFLVNWLFSGATFLTVGSSTNKFSMMFAQILSYIPGLCFLASIIIMIVGRVKYPKNTFLKVLMWIYIAVIIAFVAMYIVTMIMCISCINSSEDIFGPGDCY